MVDTVEKRVTLNYWMDFRSATRVGERPVAETTGDAGAGRHLRGETGADVEGSLQRSKNCERDLVKDPLNNKTPRYVQGKATAKNTRRKKGREG